jgi:hypothetical protein
LAAALVFATTAAARAQEPHRLKLGPLQITPRLELKNAGVDTNVFLTRSGAVPDTSVVLSPGLDGVLRVGSRLTLTGRGSVDFNYFRRVSSERSTDFSGEGRAELVLGRLTLSGGGGGGQFKQRFTVELDERLLRQEKWAHAGLDLRLSARLSAGVEGREQHYLFGSHLLGTRDVRDALDRRTRTAAAGLRYALTPRTTMVASAELIEDRFLRDVSEVRSYRYLGGFEFSPRALIRGRVLAGLREFPASAGGAPSYRGPALVVDASIPFLRWALLSARAESDVFYSAASVRSLVERLRDTSVYRRYRLELAAGLPLELLATTFVERNEARSVLPVPVDGGGVVTRVERVHSVGGSLLRRFGANLRLGGGVTWSRRRGPFVEDSFDQLVYGVQGLLIP